MLYTLKLGSAEAVAPRDGCLDCIQLEVILRICEVSNVAILVESHTDRESLLDQPR